MRNNCILISCFLECKEILCFFVVSSFRLELSSCVECQAGRGRGAASGWSSLHLLHCCFWMSQLLDWIPTLQTASLVYCTSTVQQIFYCSSKDILTICGGFCKSIVIFKHLSRLARRGKTVIFSIHQPRYSIFKQFDHLTLMHKGEVVYAGAAAQALDYFTNLGMFLSDFQFGLQGSG